MTFSHRHFKEVKTAGEQRRNQLKLFVMFNIYEAEEPIKNDLQAYHLLLNRLKSLEFLTTSAFCSQEIKGYDDSNGGLE